MTIFKEGGLCYGLWREVEIRRGETDNRCRWITCSIAWRSRRRIDMGTIYCLNSRPLLSAVIALHHVVHARKHCSRSDGSKGWRG